MLQRMRHHQINKTYSSSILFHIRSRRLFLVHVMMFTEQSILLLIITICLSSIQCDDPQASCPRGEKYVKDCMEVVSCKARVKPDHNCDGQCVCENNFSVRNDENVCVRIWDCPGVCPPNTSFRLCGVKYVPYPEHGLTAEEFSELCKPKCCSIGYSWIFEFNGCYPVPRSEDVRDYYMRFG